MYMLHAIFLHFKRMSQDASVDVRDAELSFLIKETVASVRTNIICERAAKIQTAVARCVTMLLAEVANIEPMFKPEELIQVGSYAEGTKILEPDEFDFLVVIEELSRPGAIAIDNDPTKVHGFTHLPSSGYVTLSVADDNLKSKWENYCENGLIQCFQYSNRRPRFGSVFIKGIRKFYKERVAKRVEGTVILISSTEIDFVNAAVCMPAVGGISLKLRRAELKTPNVLIDFEYEDLKISVDLSPAIRYHSIKNCFHPEKCAGPRLSETILHRNSLLLVANRNFDFRITVTEAEVDYILHIMKNEHKTIYIFLKYINSLFSTKNKNWSPFSSYMLKSICLGHDLNCHIEDIDIFSCLKVVLDVMRQVCTDNEIPSSVNSDIDLAVGSLVPEDTEYRNCMVVALLQICSQSNHIKTVDEFKKVSDSIVEKIFLKFQSTYLELRYMHKLSKEM